MYRPYGWSDEQRRQLLIDLTKHISSLEIKAINVIIDKEKILTSDYQVLKTALTYNIQRIENDSAGKWHYLIITHLLGTIYSKNLTSYHDRIINMKK